MKIVESAQKAVEILNQHKVADVKVIDVSEQTPFSSNYVLGTLDNERALAAVADDLAEKLEDSGFKIRSIEGTPNSGWVLVDADDVIVHLFMPYKRKELALEDLLEKRWSRGKK